VTLLAGSPTATRQWTVLRPLAAEPPPARDDELRETMALLHAVERRPPTVVLSRHPFASMMTLWMARPQLFVAPDTKSEGFRAFAARHDVGVVILECRLRADARFATDGEFLALWDETDTGCFAVLRSPGGHRVAVRRDLLKRE
jgi:hypothetical protein